MAYLSDLASKGQDEIEQFAEVLMSCDQPQILLDVINQKLAERCTGADAEEEGGNLDPLYKGVSQGNLSDDAIIQQLTGYISRFFFSVDIMIYTNYLLLT